MPDTAANYRMLHTMIRVKDLDKSLAFYTGPMGMQCLRKREVPEGKYTLAFVGYGDEKEHCAVELTYNWDQEKPYELGTGFGHLAVGVPDVYSVCDQVTKTGGKVTRAPGPVKFGTKGIALDVQHMPDGQRNEALQAVHEQVLDVLLPLVAADCNFTWDDWVRERFYAHLTLAMADLTELLIDEVYDFIRELGTVEPSVFTADSFHLYAFESDDWHGAWWETMSWRLLHSWRLETGA